MIFIQCFSCNNKNIVEVKQKKERKKERSSFMPREILVSLACSVQQDRTKDNKAIETIERQ